MRLQPIARLDEAGVDGPTPARRPLRRRYRWLIWISGLALAFLLGLSALFAYLAHHFEPFLRARIVEALQERFHTRVELAYFHIDVHHGQEATWGLWATGRGLRIWPPMKRGGDVPLETAVESKPLIDLGEFSFHVPLRFQMMHKIHISEVRLKGLTIEVPPKSERDKHTGFESAVDSPVGQTAPPEKAANADKPGALTNVSIDRILCQGADLILETDKPGKIPLEFQIAQLKLTHLFAGEPMNFEAVLTNPKPQGLIHTTGRFGPLATGDPGESPIDGKYAFDHADLSTFKGIAGMLASTGSYKGTLRKMQVDGQANVPDFRLTHFGNQLPLQTTFHARVDGTNGDTWLEPVNATLGHSQFTTSGKIVRERMESEDAKGVPKPMKTDHDKPAAGKQPTDKSVPAMLVSNSQRVGHLIDLKVDIDHGAMEDFMRLVSKSERPLLVGSVSAKANLHIPPGPVPVHLRMKLDGEFALDDARFTNDTVQKKVETLSLRGQGKPNELKTADPSAIRSTMEGAFHMSDGVISLPDLRYAVPGAEIRLHGTYALEGDLHFDGTARMQATVSQMVGGWKGFLLKPVDRLFKKDGAGALVPIKIRGTKSAPDFGVDVGKIGHTSPERPGEKQH